MLSAGLASNFAPRIGVRPIAGAGMVLTILGLLLFARMPVDGSYAADVLPGMILSSLGMGAIFMPLTLVATTGLDNEDQGLASGLFNTSQQVGGALGLAVLSAVATARTTDVMDAAHGAKAALPHALTEGFQNAFAVGAIFAAVAIVLGAFLLRGREVAAQTETPVAVAEPEAA
jgi:MFS family permease